MSSPDQLVVTVLESPIMVTAITFYYFRIMQKVPDHICERLSSQRLRNQDRFKLKTGAFNEFYWRPEFLW